jgi:hypothetical protein
VTHHERAIQLRQFLDRPAEIEVGDVSRSLRMPQQRIQNQRSRSRNYCTLIPECKKRAYSPSLSPLAMNFDCQPNQGLKDVRIIVPLPGRECSQTSINSSLRPDGHYNEYALCFG